MPTIALVLRPIDELFMEFGLAPQDSTLLSMLVVFLLGVKLRITAAMRTKE